MSDELDLNKITAEFLQSNLERMIQAAASSAKDVRNLVKVRLQRTYRTYITRLLERHARGKSFFIRSEPIPLYDFFVPLDLQTQLRVLKKPGAAELTRAAKFSIITGSGGSGKSMMMRHLLVSALRSGQKTPVFLELRHLNQTGESLIPAIVRTMQQSGLEIDQDFLESALEAGQILLLLDGFDEVDQTAREPLAADVQGLARRYPLNSLVLSSRPDSVLQGWEDFTQFSLVPLTLEKAVALISKVPFDDATRSRFIADLEERLYDEHTSFLSNPLLLSIMLLTYSDVAQIPHKMSTFYSQAYEALFHRHDALKSGYRRDRQTELDIQDFSRVFSAFSLISYDKREFSFTDSRAIELLDTAKTLSMLDFDSRSFLEDAIQAICLLVEEGLEVTFSHRSFQEYFVARFIHASPPELKAKLVDRFVPSIESDAVMSLLHEMDPYIVEKHFILPTLAGLRKQLGIVKKAGITHLLRFLRIAYNEFYVMREYDQEGNSGVVATIGNPTLDAAIHFAFFRYRDPENLMHDRKALLHAFEEEFGIEANVPTSTLSLKSPFLRTLANSSRLWSLDFLQSLLDVEGEIRKRHADNKETIEDILRII